MGHSSTSGKKLSLRWIFALQWNFYFLALSLTIPGRRRQEIYFTIEILRTCEIVYNS